MFTSSAEPNNYFYNLTCLTLAERVALKSVNSRYAGLRVEPFEEAESTEPSPSDCIGLSIVEQITPEAFSGPISTIAVPGHGSSIFGAAALARQVANVVDGPVFSVVCSEGQQNITSAVADPVGFSQSGVANSQSNLSGKVSEDQIALEQLIALAGKDLRTLVGYSRGGWVIANALQRIDRSKLNLDRLRFFNFGGVVRVHSAVRAKQFLGDLDLVGTMHSDLTQPYDRIPRAGHHLSLSLPGGLDLPALLSEAIQQE